MKVAAPDGTAQAISVAVGDNVPASEAARVDRLEITQAAGEIPELERSSGFKLGSIVLDVTLQSGSMAVQPMSAMTVCVPVPAELAERPDADLELMRYDEAGE